MAENLNPLRDLPRLGEEALGPCVGCKKVILATGSPLFQRVRIQRCGVDANEVRRHVGLAQTIAPGADGLALASVLGPKVEPVVVMSTYVVNVCNDCARKPFEDLLFMAMEAE